MCSRLMEIILYTPQIMNVILTEISKYALAILVALRDKI